MGEDTLKNFKHFFIKLRGNYARHNFVIFYNLAKKYGHKFPELTAAQAMHETSNGASPSGKNNYLGFESVSLIS